MVGRMKPSADILTKKTLDTEVHSFFRGLDLFYLYFQCNIKAAKRIEFNETYMADFATEFHL